MITLQIGEDPAHRDFAQKAILIGRSAVCHVVLDDRRASRRHARIERLGEQVQLVDLGSGNGTLLNGRKVRTEALMTGDVIQIGRTQVTVMRLRGTASSPAEDELSTSGLHSVALPESRVGG